MAASSQQSPRSRALRWEGCCNVRDLGGLPLEDGGETRFRIVVRGDDVSLLSHAGWQAAVDYGVTRIVDLRHEDPPYEPPVELVRIPLLDAESTAEVDELLLDVDHPVEWRRRNYLFLLDRFQANFSRAVSEVATAPEGPVLIHCAGGIDRTGLLAALILRVAGVDVKTIAADYEASAVGWEGAMEPWIAEAPDARERRKRRLLSVISAQTMHDVLVDLEREHGSARGFLVAGRVDEVALDGLSARLRG